MCVKVTQLKRQLFPPLGGVQGQCVLEVTLAANSNATSLHFTAKATFCVICVCFADHKNHERVQDKTS